MSNQEAIENLRETIKMQKSALSGLPTNFQPKAKLNNDIAATELAISALEKQIPKKPDREDKTDMRCPVCGNWSSKIFENQYCCYCGQKIVRSVEE